MRVRATIGTLFLMAGLALAALALPTILEQERAVSAYGELSEEKSPDVVPDAIDWDALLATNPSLVAWCRVEGTSIDLPVCQATDEEPTFWLSHDFWGDESTAGTPYVDHRTSATSRHVLCYGHHLAGTGGMFSDVYRCHEQGEFDRWLMGDLVWSTPDGMTTRLHPPVRELPGHGLHPRPAIRLRQNVELQRMAPRCSCEIVRDGAERESTCWYRVACHHPGHMQLRPLRPAGAHARHVRRLMTASLH